MNKFRKRLKRKVLNKNAEIKDIVDTYIQPFKQLPCVHNTGKENAERINAHDLFSLYTADIIKEDIIYAR